jgi:hypothetical protein
MTTNDANKTEQSVRCESPDPAKTANRRSPYLFLFEYLNQLAIIFGLLAALASAASPHVSRAASPTAEAIYQATGVQGGLVVLLTDN